MIRKILGSLATVGLLALVTGCGGASSGPPAGKSSNPADVGKELKDPSKDLKDGAKDLLKDAKDAGKNAVDAGKEGLTKLSDFATKEYPAIETKINGLSGDAKTKATEAFTALKKSVEDAKAFVSDPAKMKAAWDDITAKLAALKKQVGL